MEFLNIKLPPTLDMQVEASLVGIMSIKHIQEFVLIYLHESRIIRNLEDFFASLCKLSEDCPPDCFARCNSVAALRLTCKAFRPLRFVIHMSIYTPNGITHPYDLYRPFFSDQKRNPRTCGKPIPDLNNLPDLYNPTPRTKAFLDKFLIYYGNSSRYQLLTTKPLNTDFVAHS